MIAKLRDAFRPESSYRAFFISILTFALAYGLYKGIIDNYLAEVAGMSEFDKGVSEFFRELPGLALIFVLAALYELSAERIYQVGALIMLAGMAMQSFIPSTKVLVIIAIFIYSLGEHIQLGMRNTLTLEYAKEGKSGVALGRQSAMYQIGMLAGYFVVIALFAVLGNRQSLYKPVFLFFGNRFPCEYKNINIAPAELEIVKRDRTVKIDRWVIIIQNIGDT